MQVERDMLAAQLKEAQQAVPKFERLWQEVHTIRTTIHSSTTRTSHSQKPQDYLGNISTALGSGQIPATLLESAQHLQETLLHRLQAWDKTIQENFVKLQQCTTITENRQTLFSKEMLELQKLQEQVHSEARRAELLQSSSLELSVDTQPFHSLLLESQNEIARLLSENRTLRNVQNEQEDTILQLQKQVESGKTQMRDAARLAGLLAAPHEEIERLQAEVDNLTAALRYRESALDAANLELAKHRQSTNNLNPIDATKLLEENRRLAGECAEKELQFQEVHGRVLNAEEVAARTKAQLAEVMDDLDRCKCAMQNTEEQARASDMQHTIEVSKLRQALQSEEQTNSWLQEQVDRLTRRVQEEEERARDGLRLSGALEGKEREVLRLEGTVEDLRKTLREEEDKQAQLRRLHLQTQLEVERVRSQLQQEANRGIDSEQILTLLSQKDEELQKIYATLDRIVGAMEGLQREQLPYKQVKDELAEALNLLRDNVQRTIVEKQDLEQKVAAESHAKRQLEQNLELLTARYNDLEMRQREVTRLTAVLEAKDKEITRLEQLVDGLERRCSDSESGSIALTQQLGELRSQLHVEEMTKQWLQEQVDRMTLVLQQQNEREREGTRVTATREESIVRIDTSVQLLSEQLRNIQEIEQSNQKSWDSMGRFQAALDALVSRIDSVQREAEATLKAELSASQERLAGSQSALDRERQEHSRERDRAAALAERLSGAEEVVRNLQSELQSIKNRNEQILAEEAALRARTAELETEREKLRHWEATAMALQQRLPEETQRQHNELILAQTQLAQMQSTAREQDLELARLADSLEAARVQVHSLTGLSERLSKLEPTLTQKEAELDALSQERQALVAEVSHLRNQLDGTERERQQHLSTIHLLQENAAQDAQELEQVKEVLTRLTAELETERESHRADSSHLGQALELCRKELEFAQKEGNSSSAALQSERDSAARLAEMLLAKDQQLASVNEINKTLSTENSRLAAEVSSARETVLTLKEQVHTTVNREQWTSEISSLHTGHESSTRQLLEMLQNLSVDTSRAKEDAREREKLERRLEEAHNQLKETQSQLNFTKGACQDYQLQIVALQTLVESTTLGMQGRIEDLSTQLAEAVSARNAAAENVNRLVDLTQADSKKFDEVSRENRHLEGETIRLGVLLSEKERQLSELRDCLDQAREEANPQPVMQALLDQRAVEIAKLQALVESTTQSARSEIERLERALETEVSSSKQAQLTISSLKAEITGHIEECARLAQELSVVKEQWQTATADFSGERVWLRGELDNMSRSLEQRELDGHPARMPPFMDGQPGWTSRPLFPNL
eukprot:TRINITY_DN2075_c0_g2_i6.p1 TRINITY_DN2075_c0_g2~~TRINITY_DN2075_c0_g2_i6.p1  ORF type:complete len:1442 (+),score=335.16 TRINITY_DN2075_c0_g2_i6:348-4328(+)